MPVNSASCDKAHASATSAADIAIAYALDQVGKQYLWGGTGPDRYDCSGLTQMAYKCAGVDIPRVSSAQANSGQSVTREQLQPGDLIFPYWPVTHVAMYIGNGQIVEAPKANSPVQVTGIYKFSSAKRYVDGGMGIGSNGVPTTGTVSNADRNTPLGQIETLKETLPELSPILLIGAVIVAAVVGLIAMSMGS